MVTKVRILTHNNWDVFSNTKVTVSGIQCGDLGTNDKATWLEFVCPTDTYSKAKSIKLERNSGSPIIFCGIEVWGEENEETFLFDRMIDS